MEARLAHRRNGLPVAAAGVGRQKERDYRTAVSKEMARKLRHDPPEGMDGCGFVPVESLVGEMTTRPSVEDVLKIVETDAKGRYQVDCGLGEPGEGPRVRAVQGHSIELENPMHDSIRGPQEVPLALHATSHSRELRRMSRTHIHFASEPKHLRGNDWACVLLKVDLKRAIEDGVGFCRAANGVVLSEGPIPLHYISRVRFQELPQKWQDQAPNRRVVEQELKGNIQGAHKVQ